MMDPTVLKAMTEYGVAIVGLIFLTRFLMWLIKYILERNKQREDAILLMLTTDIKHLTESMNTLALNMTNFVSSVNEAHKFQREEHMGMIESLTSISTVAKGCRKIRKKK
jgi:hypothetical protein